MLIRSHLPEKKNISRRSRGFAAFLTILLAAGCWSTYSFANLKTFGDDNIYLDSLYDPAYDPNGLKLGDFTLYPSVTGGWKYTDNVFAQEDAVSDSILVTRPSLSIRSDFVRHKFDIRAFAEQGRYRDFGTEDYDDYGVLADTRLDITGNTSLPFTFGYSRLHEDRETPDNNENIEPLVYQLTEATVGIVHEGQRIAAKIISGFKRMVYDSARTISGIFDTSDRDRDIYSLYTSVGITPDAVFAPYVYNQFLSLDYHSDLGGISRNSTEMEYGAGSIINISEITNISLNIGKKRRNFDDTFFDDIDALTFGANLSWQPLERLGFLLEADRTIQEATFAGTSASINTSLRLSANYQFRQNLFFQPSLGVLERDYKGVSGGRIVTQNIRLETLYKMNPNMWLTASYQYTDQEEKEDAPGLESFNRNLYGVTLKIQF